MRNYNSVSGLRPVQNHDEEEPELQWLEDSVNYLAAGTFICVGLICSAIARGIVRAYEGLQSNK